MYSTFLLESIEAKRALEAGEEIAKISVQTVKSINDTAHNLEAEYKSSDAALKAQREDYEDYVETIRKNSTKWTKDEKAKFKNELTKKLEDYKKDFEVRQENERHRFEIMVGLVKDSLFAIQMESITNRLYVISLFNDFCNALFNIVFERCDTTKVPTIHDDFEQIKTKLKNIEKLSTEVKPSKPF